MEELALMEEVVGRDRTITYSLEIQECSLSEAQSPHESTYPLKR